MVKIINPFFQENPLAKAIKGLSDTMFGDTLTPALKRQQLQDSQRETLGREEVARNFGSAGANGIDVNHAAEFSILGGMKPEDLSMYNVFLNGNKTGPRSDLTTNAMAGAGKYGDSAENLDLNRNNVLLTNAADNATSVANNKSTVDNAWRMKEADNATTIQTNDADNSHDWRKFFSDPQETNVNGKPGYATRGQIINQTDGQLDLRTGIEQTAKGVGVDPIDLATAISYETGGTFDPLQKGPITQHGQHRGYIQFGEPQARQYGVDWNNPVGSQLGENGAIAKYLRQAGVKPGMGLMEIYSAINAGSVGRNNASDANNGGAPGTVEDKVNYQMAGHRKKAAEMFGGQVPFPAAPGNTYSPISKNTEKSPVDQLFGYVDAFKAANPGSTEAEQRAYALSQISKQKSKGITVYGDDGNPSVQIGGDGEMPGITNANATKMQASELNARKFDAGLAMATDLIAKNPGSVGAQGVVRDYTQDVGIMAKGLAESLGVADIDGQMNQVVTEAKARGLNLDFEYDPSIGKIGSLMSIIAYQGAAAIGGQTGNDLSDKDFNTIKGILGDPRSLFTNSQKMLSKLDQVGEYVDMQRRINLTAMGLPLPPPRKKLGANDPSAAPPPSGPAPVGGTVVEESWTIGADGNPVRVQ